MILILWFSIIAAAVVLDQVTKMIVVKNLMPIGSADFIKGIVGFRYTENTGAAFGMLKDHRWFFLIFSSIAIIAVMIILVVYRKKMHPLLSLTLAFFAGGGIGNQIDRLVKGYVVDFIEFQFVDFAIFNVADIFVTVGACIGILYFLIFEVFRKNGEESIKNEN